MVSDDVPKLPVNIPPELGALIDPAVPKLYANGFSLGLTNADAQLVLMLFGRPIAVLNVSYTLAKTMAEKFSQLVKDWETKTGATLQTTQTIDKAFAEPREKGKKPQ